VRNGLICLWTSTSGSLFCSRKRNFSLHKIGKNFLGSWLTVRLTSTALIGSVGSVTLVRFISNFELNSFGHSLALLRNKTQRIWDNVWSIHGSCTNKLGFILKSVIFSQNSITLPQSTSCQQFTYETLPFSTVFLFTNMRQLSRNCSFNIFV